MARNCWRSPRKFRSRPTRWPSRSNRRTSHPTPPAEARSKAPPCWCRNARPTNKLVPRRPEALRASCHEERVLRRAAALVCQRPGLQGFQELLDQTLRRLIVEVALVVEAVLRLRDHHLGLVDGEHVEEDADLAQVILRSRRAEHAAARAHHGNRLAVERLVRRARGPVDRVLENTRDRVVVFRG